MDSDFLKGYLNAVLSFFSIDSRQPLDAKFTVDHFAPEAVARAKEDCNLFQGTSRYSLREFCVATGVSEEDAGAFFLQNRHHNGLGFASYPLAPWSRGLARAAGGLGTVRVWVGADNKLTFVE